MRLLVDICKHGRFLPGSRWMHARLSARTAQAKAKDLALLRLREQLAARGLQVG
jgi:hypothetical protein